MEYYDRVKETSTTTGTGNFTLAGAVTGFRTFGSVLSVNDTCGYCIALQGGSEWEVGIGTYSATNTLTRTTVLASSNSGSAVNFSSGTKDVFITIPAREMERPTFSVHRNGTDQTISTGSWVKVDFTTELFDTHGYFASGAFTPQIAGYYDIKGCAAIKTPDNEKSLYIGVYKNGAIYSAVQVNTSGNLDTSLYIGSIVYLNGSTDYIELYVYQGSGSNKSISGNAVLTYFCGNRVA